MTPEEKHRYTHFQEQLTFFVKRAQIKTLFPVFLVISGILYILVLLGSHIEFSKELPPARRGIVYNLGPDQAVRLNALRNRTPLDTYIPPWADPAHDTLEIAPLKPKRGIEPTPLPPTTSPEASAATAPSGTSPFLRRKCRPNTPPKHSPPPSPSRNSSPLRKHGEPPSPAPPHSKATTSDGSDAAPPLKSS